MFVMPRHCRAASRSPFVPGTLPILQCEMAVGSLAERCARNSLRGVGNSLLSSLFAAKKFPAPAREIAGVTERFQGVAVNRNKFFPASREFADSIRSAAGDLRYAPPRGPTG